MLNSQTEILANTQPFSLVSLQDWGKSQKQILRWVQPKRLQSSYLLRSQDQNLGTLNYEESHFIRHGFAKTSDKEWHFKYTRFSLPKVTIQKRGDLFAQTILETNWGWRGTLILPERRFCWKSTDETENEFGFFTPEGYSLVLFRPRYGFLKLEAEIEIEPTVFHSPYIPLLAMLGWFLVLLRLR